MLQATAALARPAPADAVAFVMDAPLANVAPRLEVLRQRRILRAGDGVYYLPPNPVGEQLVEPDRPTTRPASMMGRGAASS